MDLNSEELTRLNQVAKNQQNPQEGDLLIGNLCVMASAAGYYIGRPCIECFKNHRDSSAIEWFAQPYNRETNWYFPTKEEATTYLKEYTLNGDWK